MAGKSLGTLTIDLVANVGGFVRGMDQAERASEEWRKSVEKSAAAVTKGIAAAGVAAAGLVTAGVALVKSTAEQVAETDRYAKALGTSTQSLLQMQYAAKQMGFQGDQVADLLKDISDNVGDAVNNGGNFADTLNQIGLSAKALSQLRPEEQLNQIATAIVNSGKSFNQQSNWAETFGNDLTLLLPLYRNGGEELRKYQQQALDLHVAPSDEEIEKLRKVNDFIKEMEGALTGLKNQIAVTLLNIDLTPLTGAFESLRNLLTDPQTLEGLVKLGGELASVANSLIQTGAAAGNIIDKLNTHRAGRTGNVDPTNMDQINARITELEHQSTLNDFQNAGRGLALGINTPERPERNAELLRLYHQRNVLRDQQSKAAQGATGNNAGQITSDLLTSLTTRLAPGQQNADPSKAASAQSALANAIKTTTQNYANQLKQIDANGKSLGDLTELQKLNQQISDGSLKGASSAQQDKLRALASEVDRRKALNAELQKQQQLEQFVNNLNTSNQNESDSLNASIAGAGLGDTARQRQTELAQIKQQYNGQIRDLLNQASTTDNSPDGKRQRELLNDEVQATQDAMNKRLKIQQDYYDKTDALQGDWLKGAQEGLSNWADSNADIYSTVSQGVQTALGSGLDNLTSMLEGNKVSWKQWGTSILEILEKVALQEAAVSLFGSKSSGSSGLFGSLVSGIGSFFGGGSTTANAKGGVYDSPNLSAFSNSIVNKPTRFAFASGAGLMGEAGPEAIIPLSRASDGSLGVKASGLNSPPSQPASGVQVNITVSDSGSSSNTNSSDWRQFGNEIGRFVDERYKRNLSRDLRDDGDIGRAMKGRR